MAKSGILVYGSFSTILKVAKLMGTLRVQIVEVFVCVLCNTDFFIFMDQVTETTETDKHVALWRLANQTDSYYGRLANQAGNNYETYCDILFTMAISLKAKSLIGSSTL